MTRRLVQLITLLVCLAVGMMSSGLGSIPGEAAKHRRNRVKSEVFRGDAVPVGKYPFMTAVGLADGNGGLKKKFCGGSLIGPSSVLTAAHCARGADPGELAVHVGTNEVGAGQGQVRVVSAVFIHPNFSSRTLKYDVAVLRLNQPITDITPIALVAAGDESYTYGGAPLTITGWGNITGFRGKRPRVKYPKVLREASISVVGNGTCSRRWRAVGVKNGIPGPSDFCTSANRFGPGDSGGPVFSLLTGAPVQVGLVSAGLAGEVRVGKIPDLSTELSDPDVSSFINSVRT